RHGRGAGRAAVRSLRHRGARLPVRAPAGGHPRSRRRAVGGGPAPPRRSRVSERVTGDMTEIDEAEARGRTELWPFWRRVYAQGDPRARPTRASYLAEELKHAIMFHRLAVGLERDFALKDVPYAHYAFHLPRETSAE